MNDVSSSLMPTGNANEAPLSGPTVIAALADALRGRRMSARHTIATEEVASPDEGLALVQGFLAIRDPRVRQAILDAVAMLASESP